MNLHVLLQSVLDHVSQQSMPVVAGFVILFLAYLPIASLLRFERVNRMHKKFPYSTRKSFAKMTNEDAHTILMYLAEKEFPLMFATAVQFALFKTYGIPSISNVLASTGQMNNEKSVSRRAADTQALLFEFAFNSPSSDRTINAIARMNFLHSSYQRAGKITNDDLLYTLSLFTLEPDRWISHYEWRRFTDMEVCAIGTFWKSMGDAMGISYAELSSQKWSDGTHWLEELKDWSLTYETKHMIPAVSNPKVASSTIGIFLWKLPLRFKVVGQNIITVLLEERLRRAIMFEDPSPIYHAVVPVLMHIRRLALRHLCLPRMIHRPLTGTRNPTTGGYWATDHLAHPWYVKPTIVKRWGSMAWLDRLLGCTLPGDDGKTYFPDGYIPAEVGPEKSKHKGVAYMSEVGERASCCK